MFSVFIGLFLNCCFPVASSVVQNSTAGVRMIVVFEYLLNSILCQAPSCITGHTVFLNFLLHLLSLVIQVEGEIHFEFEKHAM
jgi:uncharacterized membrane protein YdjX (TVP38/TMEM64 family)